jgi:hypothetical protein
VGGRSRARPGRFDVAFVDAFDALGDLGVVTVGTPRPARRAPCLCSVRVACLSAARRCADARGVEAHGGVGSGTGPGVTEWTLRAFTLLSLLRWAVICALLYWHFLACDRLRLTYAYRKNSIRLMSIYI